MSRARSQLPRVDWDAARTFYIALGLDERSYARVAAEFRVSDKTVRKWAHRQDWPAQAREADAAVADAALLYVHKTRSERVSMVLTLVDSYVEKVAAKLKAGDLDVKASDVAALVKVAELLSGEPTDRIQVAQLRPLLDAYDAAIEELRGLSTDRDRADQIVRALDEDLLAFAATTRERT
jgi:hypothetical protein